MVVNLANVYNLDEQLVLYVLVHVVISAHMSSVGVGNPYRQMHCLQPLRVLAATRLGDLPCRVLSRSVLRTGFLMCCRPIIASRSDRTL